MSTLEINVEGCKGCGLCVDNCSRKVLVMTSEVHARGHFMLLRRI